jgi:hypothetical protein
MCGFDEKLSGDSVTKEKRFVTLTPHLCRF